MTTTVRIPLRLEQALAQYCTENRRSKSEVIIELLEQRFSAAQPEKTAYEIACETGFIGSLTAAEDLTSNAKARVRDAIARKHGRA
jgi:DNA recombination-dependent growth factor C